MELASHLIQPRKRATPHTHVVSQSSPLPPVFDVQSQKATRLTPKKLFGWDGVWLDNDNVLFLSRAAGEKEDSIYRMSTDGENLKRLIKNARFASVSAP